MWEPDPSWRALPGVGGPSSLGLWRAVTPEGAWVVKRLAAPAPGEDHLARDRTHPGYWRREADVALRPGFVAGPGLVAAGFGPVEDDDEGVTVWARERVGHPPTGLQVARSLGRFAGAPHDAPAWASHDLLRRRLDLVEQRGGWRTLARTTLADVTDLLWSRRGHWLDRLAQGPQGRLHGDAVPSNFLATDEDGTVVAVDWQCVGVGPVGTDLGYWSLSSREDFEVLLEAYLDGAVAESAERLDREAVAVAARVTAAYSVLSRAEWALAQAARGEGALAGKFRHPAVAPYLRAVQRQFPQIERLVA
ncbi:Phosphotransferase enzyme family protein [Nocardioides scoriae]|uniref:Phosphotransferase enzyme family protein n=1 Tax=Nocardioides scoriae TaxID=642780 RepID=A0A1H1N9Z9_9ACTN|nr:phosphotransferase [Nocardioides scoriae]SDR95794.1 Phosphotransferase enzyme family protein [Nocardioides scoriae]